MEPKAGYAKSGGVHIAYQVVGEGPLDLVLVPGFVSHLEVQGEHPPIVRFMERLASFSRLILFDKRGTGLSDRVEIASLEQRMDDARAVMDAVGSERAVVFGLSEGGSMAALFAATYPGRTVALILYGAFARFISAPDFPWALTPKQFDRVIDQMENTWGTGWMLPVFAPSLVHDEREKAWLARFERMSASPGAAVALLRMNTEIDIREVLPVIRVPTLILHRRDELVSRVGNARYMAERIPGAKYVELQGNDHNPYVGDSDAIVGEIEEFLTGTRAAPEPERVLATVLFTDIVGSTERAAELGDRRWRDLREQHDSLVRQELDRFRGREIETAGDSFLATFDGPARAIRCACGIRNGVQRLGLTIRAGVHTGECELTEAKVGGIAVHIGARVAAQAMPGEVLVSRTVKDLVAGSRIDFSDRGTCVLKGVPGEWQLFAARA